MRKLLLLLAFLLVTPQSTHANGSDQPQDPCHHAPNPKIDGMIEVVTQVCMDQATGATSKALHLAPEAPPKGYTPHVTIWDSSDLREIAANRTDQFSVCMNVAVEFGLENMHGVCWGLVTASIGLCPALSNFITHLSNWKASFVNAAKPVPPHIDKLIGAMVVLNGRLCGTV